MATRGASKRLTSPGGTPFSRGRTATYRWACLKRLLGKAPSRVRGGQGRSGRGRGRAFPPAAPSQPAVADGLCTLPGTAPGPPPATRALEGRHITRPLASEKCTDTPAREISSGLEATPSPSTGSFAPSATSLQAPQKGRAAVETATPRVQRRASGFRRVDRSVFTPAALRPDSFRGTGRKRERERERMSLSDWHLAVKLADQPLAPKSILQLPESELGEYSLGGYSISFLKQLIAGKLQESVPDPELIDLIYCGRKLKDDQTLDFYGIQPGSTVHVLRKSWPEPDQKPEPVDRAAALREFRVLHTALHSSSSYREAVFKMLSNKESLDQIIVATPGLSSDPIALGVLQDKDLFSVFADPSMLDT
ncbi:hypothetical protein GH733_004511 [Mirounga leonina]|nr:hypothetical protein GH733_004511 [Mirounga leonina]